MNRLTSKFRRLLACVLIVGVFIWLFDFVAQVGIDSLIKAFHAA